MTVHRLKPDAPLFAPALRRDAAPTSVAAAVKVAPAVGTQARAVLDAILRAGAHGMIDEETCRATGLHDNSVRPRRGSLASAGLIRKAGTRENAAGNDCDVWVAVEGEA